MDFHEQEGYSGSSVGAMWQESEWIYKVFANLIL